MTPIEPFPTDMVLSPVSRAPTQLPKSTVDTVLATSAPINMQPGAVPHPVVYPEAHPQASIVIVTFNALIFTRMCLATVLAHSGDLEWEIIAVDNGSSDGTPEYLEALRLTQPRIQVIQNDTNRGFAAANNQGLERARGDLLILLNSDTLVPSGWLGSLARHISDPTIGLLGPRTNRCGNVAEIRVGYDSYGEFVEFARQYGALHAGEELDVDMLSMFCMAMRRDVFESLGPLDERFEVGTFEDDDYSLRARLHHYRVVLAGDVFVHHFGQGSFGNLIQTGEYARLLESNRQRFERKWQTVWQPPRPTMDPAYEQLVRDVQTTVDRVLPEMTKVLVLSKGDDRLLRLGRRTGVHFPCLDDGTYAGFYPAHSQEAIGQLESLRRKNGAFLVVPATSKWWLDYYQGFSHHLKSRYRTILAEPDLCWIFALDDESSRTSSSASPAQHEQEAR
jgi:GT2 family glycosyltransferase